MRAGLLTSVLTEKSHPVGIWGGGLGVMESRKRRPQAAGSPVIPHGHWQVSVMQGKLLFDITVKESSCLTCT